MAFTIETSEPLDTGSRMITLGGNRSMFKMEVQESAVNWKETFQSLHREERLLALGDLWLTAEERAKCDFIWGTSKDFRYMTNETSKAHSWEKPKKSRLYHLLNRGCVIYADSTVLKEIEKKHANLQLAGLNLLV